jgi:hypothetical protein
MPNITHLGLCGLEKASESDRRWFERHPHRGWRLRKSIFGEKIRLVDPLEPPQGFTRWTVVKQIEPGFRVRAFCVGPIDAVPVESDDPIAELLIYVIENVGRCDWQSFSSIARHCFLPANGRAVA